MVFCLAKSFVPRVLIDFEIFQYQFAPNCNTERGATGALCRWRRSLVCIHRARIFSPGSRTDGMPTIANSFFPPHPPRRGKGSGSLLFLPPLPPLFLFPFYFSRFNRFLPLFTVLLLAPRHLLLLLHCRVTPLRRAPSTIFLNSNGF